MAGLSKSKIMSSLQCLKRVHLEINRKDLIHYSRATEAAFALGHEVGDIAIQLYGGTNSEDNGGAFIEYNGGNFSRGPGTDRAVDDFDVPGAHLRSNAAA